ncbi:histone demethylase utx [Lasius niger]|uniref:Histone demethylase utx n=1 Tax=Lasius niger TaxID=67767 RepID=A0A0J7L108_LASNI|nr:histone demethylase utx [Lasius niger]
MENIDWLRLPEQELSIEADARTIIKACIGKGLNSVPKCSLLNVCQRAPPKPPSERLTKIELSPSTPTIRLNDKNDAFAPWVREYCLKQPIVVISGLVSTFNFNVALFSTKTIVEVSPNDKIEVRMQMQQTREENWDQTYSQKIWDYYSHRKRSTILEYANYQATKFQKSMRQEIQNNETTSDRSNLDSNRIDQKMIKRKKQKLLRFGTNVDLSNKRKWKPQLEELKKLPPLFQVESNDNMLNYVDYKILGMNTVQLYMKIPGCRTPGHQENNNFCSVNINIGPGDCEWFAVPQEYWGALCSLCERNGVDYLHGSWWPPNLDELYKENIPVYRFHQKPGQLVWVNVGCVHWVQAIGYCNNIAWNVGPITARQYQFAIERYEWNKLRAFQSIVPMVHLSWNLARNVKVSDAQLYKQEPEEELIIEPDAKTMIEACKGKGLNSVPKCSLVSVSPQVPPYPPNRQLVKEQLSPSIPIIQLDKKLEGFEPWVEEFCRKYPIVMIRNLCSLVGFKLSLFWAESIAKKHPKDKMEIRTQMQQISNENWDETYSKNIWNCYSQRNYTTIGSYKKYYNERFNKTLNEAKKYATENQIDLKDENLFYIMHNIIERPRRGKIDFGTNVDLSCPKKWKLELQEIKKLPPYLQVNSDNNMLSDVGHKILGMNTVQLYIQVPGCRITGHQENNNFCSVNINIGAGSCEWFAVSQEYWGALSSLCERNNVDFLHGSWWPPTLDELYRENIPVYRFIQYRGDVVWVNAGCIYWVQAIGYCSTIAWNVGPFFGKQYKLAIERYEWNKLHSFQSIVPMVHLSWNLARNAKISDLQLYRLIKNCTLQSLRECYLILEFVKNKGVKMESYERSQKKTMHYCYKCRRSPLLEGFNCTEKYDMQDLMNIYDSFTLDLSRSAFPEKHPLATIYPHLWALYQSVRYNVEEIYKI